MLVDILVKYNTKLSTVVVEQYTPCSIISIFICEKAAEMWRIIVLLAVVIAGVNCSCVSYT